MTALRVEHVGGDHAITAFADALVEEANALFSGAEAVSEALDALLDRDDFAACVFECIPAVDVADAAPDATNFKVSIGPNDAAAVFLAALGTAARDLAAVRVALAHLTGSSGGDTSTGARPAGPGNSLAGGEGGFA